MYPDKSERLLNYVHVQMVRFCKCSVTLGVLDHTNSSSFPPSPTCTWNSSDYFETPPLINVFCLDLSETQQFGLLSGLESRLREQVLVA